MKIFDKRREEAEKQINLKINLLKHWVLKGIPWQRSEDGSYIRDKDGELIPDFVPKSIVEFAAWTSANHSPGTKDSVATVNSDDITFDICLSDLSTLSRTTLNQPYRSKQKAAIEIQLKAIAEKEQAQLQRTHKISVIEALNAEIEYLKRVVSSQESEVRIARIESRQARTELEDCRRTNISNLAEFKRLNSDLEKKLARLTREYAKVSPIKPLGGSNEQ